MPIYRLALYAGIALISVGTILFLFDSPRGILGSVDLDTEQNIQAFAVARNASTNYYDEQGELSHTFKSKKLSHYRPSDRPEDSYTSVEAPDIVVFNKNEDPWHMSAETARVNSNQIIILSENVQIEQAGVNGEQTTMLTPELILDTDNKLAYTSKTVTIDSPLGEITAVGMQADLADKKITLLSKVQGRHRPQKLN